MTYFTVLCQLKGGCMGCCGYDFPGREGIRKVIGLNTLEFKELNPQTKEELVKFRDRAEPFDLQEGVCRNLIEKEGQVFCPLHPAQNQDQDLRLGHCDIAHLCETAKEFIKWEESKQERFLRFFKDKILSNIEYSLDMRRGKLLEEFEENESD